VPFGAGDDGLPVGVQLLGPALSEGTILKVAVVVEDSAPAVPSPARAEAVRP
jgi:Asp-tRNA(Asn)/Glu-tRNA(Gln) amidotransferase A subunit family amidase